MSRHTYTNKEWLEQGRLLSQQQRRRRIMKWLATRPEVGTLNRPSAPDGFAFYHHPDGVYTEIPAFTER